MNEGAGTGWSVPAPFGRYLGSFVGSGQVPPPGQSFANAERPTIPTSAVARDRITSFFKTNLLHTETIHRLDRWNLPENEP